MEKLKTNFIEIFNLSFRRGSRVIFKDLNINIKCGKITAIMGAGGSGKTTLVYEKYLFFLLKNSCYNYFIFGRNCWKIYITIYYKINKQKNHIT